MTSLFKTLFDFIFLSQWCWCLYLWITVGRDGEVLIKLFVSRLDNLIEKYEFNDHQYWFRSNSSMSLALMDFV